MPDADHYSTVVNRMCLVRRARTHGVLDDPTPENPRPARSPVALRRAVLDGDDRRLVELHTSLYRAAEPEATPLEEAETSNDSMNDSLRRSRVIGRVWGDRHLYMLGLPVRQPADGKLPTAVRPLFPWLAELENDPRFLKLFIGFDAAERKEILQQVQVLCDRCGYHHRLALLRRNWRHRRVIRQRRSARQPRRSTGRPLGAANFACRQYMLGLALIWCEQTTRRPSRYRPLRFPSKQGSFVEFVELFLGAVTAWQRASATKPPSKEYLIRVCIKDLQAARQSLDEYRRRGLIAESLWGDED